MAINCLRCGTMYSGFGECPTCKQRRLSEERNRLLQEQNKQIERQNKEIEKQTRIQEQMQREAERERSERQYEIEREKYKENFNSRIEELSNYAEERNLMSAFIYLQSDIGNVIDKNNITEWGKLGIPYYGIEKILMEKCLRKFNELKQKLNLDDRIIDAKEYGMCFTPKIKLSLIKQIANNHSEDYVIFLQPDQPLLIFPTNLAANNISTKGYENKDIQIGEFQYLMYLRNADEAKKIAQILSEAYKRIKSIHTIIGEVNKIISEYVTNNPKPQPVEPKSLKEVTGGKISVIIGIITAILAGYFIGNFFGGGIFVWFIVGLVGLVVGYRICSWIVTMIIEGKNNKIVQQNVANLKAFEKSSSDWTTNLNKTINEHINKQSFSDVSGNFLMIEDKGKPNET